MNCRFKRTFFCKVLACALLICWAVLLAGCESTQGFHGLTFQLWEEHAFSRLNHPAAPPRAQLFHSKEKDDVLVTYDEACEEEARGHRVAFFLGNNLELLAAGRKPRFVKPRESIGLEPIPIKIGIETSNSPRERSSWYACVSTNGCNFTVYAGTDPPLSFNLPTYETAGSAVARTVATPFAMVADATIVGVVLACAYIHGGGNFGLH